MKLTLEQLKAIVKEEVVAEAKRKKKEVEKDRFEKGTGYKKDDKLDMSKPQGEKNLARRQGAANFGPYTSEGALRLLVRECVREALSEKKIGFKKLKNMLAHKKGVTNPAALAASIGREKYGAAGMAKKAAAGKKKSK